MASSGILTASCLLSLGSLPFMKRKLTTRNSVCTAWWQLVVFLRVFLTHRKALPDMGCSGWPQWRLCWGGCGLEMALGWVHICLHLVLPLGLPLFYLCLQTTSLHSGWSGFGQVSALLYVFVSLRYLGVPWLINWTSLHTDSGTKQLGKKIKGKKCWWSY